MLVLIVIGSLIIIPTMTYAVTVLRANTALSQKTQRMEGIKSGLRVSLADPKALYEACGAAGTSVSVQLAATTASGNTIASKCYLLDVESAQSPTERRFGLTSTRVGTAPPPGLSGNSYVPTDASSQTEWLSQTTLLSETNKVWLPNLPEHGLNPRSPSGTEMPAGFPTCTVYFPGTYPDPVVLDGPTYFTSGVYYFQNEVRVVGGADVVVGLGAVPGCTSDQEAVFYAQNVPATHNMSGLGATWVLGDKGRVVVSNANGVPLSLRFNRRYVAPEDTGGLPSQDVSIISVNGALAGDGVTGTDLVVPGVIQVPLSLVGSVSPGPATQKEYLPSLLTPKPTAPYATAAPTAVPSSNAATVTWIAPFDGGSPITGYVVTASTGQSCATNGSTTCVITGLSNSTPVTFTVDTSNVIGMSVPSPASVAVTPGGASLAAPVRPILATVTPYAGVARVSWTAPANGGAVITSYTVTASPGGATCTVDMRKATAPGLDCDVVGLDPALLPGYTFTVTATNAVGTSPASLPNAIPVNPALALGPPPARPGPPAALPFVPVAIVDFDLPTAAATTVAIPGYVSVPQGRFRVANPNGQPVVVGGGVLAAQFDVVDARNTGPQTVDIGFVDTIVQRKLKVVSTTTAGRETSTAIVQVNENGAYAINSWQVQ